MQGNTPINREIAIQVQQHALAAVKSFSEALYACTDRCSAEEYDQIKRGVGLSIGRVETELLTIIYKQFPDLDDLA